MGMLRQEAQLHRERLEARLPEPGCRGEQKWALASQQVLRLVLELERWLAEARARQLAPARGW